MVLNCDTGWLRQYFAGLKVKHVVRNGLLMERVFLACPSGLLVIKSRQGSKLSLSSLSLKGIREWFWRRIRNIYNTNGLKERKKNSRKYFIQTERKQGQRVKKLNDFIIFYTAIPRDVIFELGDRKKQDTSVKSTEEGGYTKVSSLKTLLE